mmetsp:Transcript_18829/g.21596  ORF Transcript_18829/g.21596 Transcript_18829/m.21596 type:complete len:484 (+) Transcript_18829:190-1641(+)
MVACRNSPLLRLALSSTTLYGIFFHGDRNTTAFFLKPQKTSHCGGGCFNSCIDLRHHPSSVLVLHSFSYLGGLGADGNEDNVVESQTTQIQPPQQPFPFASSSIPSPTTSLTLQQQQQQHHQQQQRQEEEEVETPETELYFEDDLDLDLNYPAYPEPQVIANPYDFNPLREEEDEFTDFIPTVVAPVPRSATAITRSTSQAVAPVVNHNVRSIWETDAPAVVQGGSLKTWNFDSERIEAVQVLVKTNGRPLKADIELWQGESAPQKISVYTEDGDKRPFSAFVATPYPGPTAIAVKNSANMEFPLKACVEADLQQRGGSNDFSSFGPGYGNHLAKHTLQRLWDTARPKTIQGDRATYVVPFEANIGRVQILITSEKNPINARIEILEGPNNVKQVLEIATEDGKARPFFCVLELPDKVLTNVLRVVNTGPLEFPIECRVKPFEMEKELELDPDDENFYFFDDVATTASGGGGGGTSSSPFLLS